MKTILAIVLLVAGFATLPATADTLDDVMNADRAFSRMAAEKGVPAAFDHYLAEDAVTLNGGSHPNIGHEAAMAPFAGYPADATLQWEPRGGMIAASGDLAYTWGTYVSTYVKDGETKSSYGKYTTVWAKRDGEWKAVHDLGNPSPGPWPEG